jgi:hypothetical protein
MIIWILSRHCQQRRNGNGGSSFHQRNQRRRGKSERREGKIVSRIMDAPLKDAETQSPDVPLLRRWEYVGTTGRTKLRGVKKYFLW